jgi:hypothetical protein
MHTKLRITDKFGRARYQWLQHGRAGTVQTLIEMAALVRDDVETDQGLQDFANQILVRANVAGDVKRQTVAEIKTLFDYVRDKFIFRRDPTGGSEAIQDARVSIARGFGDCDDHTVLLSTLLGLVGFVTRFVVLRVNPESDGFDHVYCEVLSPRGDRWLALDASNKQALIGWEARGIERRTFSIFGDGRTNDLEGFKSFFKKVGKGIAKVGRIALPFIPVVGQIASTGVEAAVGAVQGKRATKRAEQEAAAAAEQRAADQAAMQQSIREAVMTATAGQQQQPQSGIGNLDFSNPLVIGGAALAGLFVVSTIFRR